MNQHSGNHHQGCAPFEVFAVPIGEVFLLYSPLNHLSAVINHSALDKIKYRIQSKDITPSEIDQVISGLSLPPDSIPEPRTGELCDPIFLGLLPTRGCNMACRYCDFLSGKVQVMNFDMVRWSVDGYLNLLHHHQKCDGAIHFFGGEPFHAPLPVQFAVEYARIRANDMGIYLHFETTTNGNYDEKLARWISSNLDTVVLSFDGMADQQNLHRPLRNGKPSFERVATSALIFAQGDCELVIRVCVSNRNVDHLPEIANWFAHTFHPSTICFEPLSESENSLRNNLCSPNPLTYAQKFYEATRILEKVGIPTVLSTADLSTNQVTSCPVGKDTLIVSPDGTINACYLLEKQWQKAGLDMTIGKVSENDLQIDLEALRRIRQFSVYQKTLCTDCFCRFHCAGGCHVHHDTHQPTGKYDDQCIRTRLVTAALLLDQLGQKQLCEEWLGNERLTYQTAHQISDRLMIMDKTQ